MRWTNHLLGETAVIVERPVDVVAEVVLHAQQPGLVPDKGQVRSARQIQDHAAAAQPVSKAWLPGTVHFVRPGAAGSQVRDPSVDAPHQQLMVTVFVNHRVQRLSATAADFLGQLNHLVNRLPPRQPHDKRVDQRLQLRLGLAVPVWRSTSTIIGTMTCGQPSRIKDSVPSKSNRADRNRPRGMPA